jgi:hypothetical protein
MNKEHPLVSIIIPDRTLKKCPVDIFSEGASWRAGIEN